ncbi:MAG: hypothetical protein ACRDIA_05995, partial [Actinomycetota bacterium]
MSILLACLLTGCAGSQVKPQTSPSAPANKETPASPRPSPAGGLVLVPVPSAPTAPPRATRTPKPPPGATASSPAPGQSVLPGRPGAYLFDETGFARIKGCLPLEQPAPNPTKLRVDPPAGNFQRVERDQMNAQGQGAITIADLEYRPDGIHIVYLKQSQTLLLAALPAEFRPADPPLLLPARRNLGQTWSYTLTSTDGQITADFQNVVESVGETVNFSRSGSASADRVKTTTRITGQSTQG